jgi:hypothetical protein
MMKIKHTIAALAATTLAVNAAIVTVDNYIGEPNGSESGAVGNYITQSFTPNVAGLGATDTVAAQTIPATIYLTDVTFLKAIAGTNPTTGAGDFFVNVYLGAGNGGTFVGSSANSIDVEGTAALGALNYTFANIALTDSTAQYAFVFSTTATDDTAVSARLQVARNSSGAFANSYDGGSSSNNADGSAPTSYETRFAVTYDTVAVPEPSSAALLGLGGLALILRRRK